MLMFGSMKNTGGDLSDFLADVRMSDCLENGSLLLHFSAPMIGYLDHQAHHCSCTASSSTLHLEDMEIERDASLQTHFLRKDNMAGKGSSASSCWDFLLREKIKWLFFEFPIFYLHVVISQTVVAWCV